MFEVTKKYPPVNTYFTKYGFLSKIYLYNTMDCLALSAVFIVVVPAFMLCYKFVKM
jgi:hypothetical protein